MQRFLRPLWADRPVRRGLLVSVLLIAATTVVALVTGPRGDTVPLHYNVYFGIDLVGSWVARLVPAVVLLLTTIVNTALAAALVEREPLAARLLSWFSVAVGVLVLVSTLLVTSYQP